MLRIAICDNEESCQKELLALARQLLFPVSCQCFFDGEALLAACKEQETAFDLVFMDIELSEGQSGIDLASAVRERLEDVMLIFVTGYPKYITSALKVQPDQFLLKPVQREDFFDAVSSVMDARRRRNAGTRFSFRSRSRLVTFRQDEICYLEANGHHIQVHNTKGAPFMVSSTFSREEERFLSHGFIKVHRSYLVNPHHIRRIEGRDIIMESGNRIPISKNCYQQVFDQYTAYVSAIIEDLS